MQELWASASYQPHLLSLPLALAPAAMSIVIAYGLVMRGEPVLRAWLLLHFAMLIPYAVVMTLSPSVVSAEAARVLFRIAAATIPMAAAAGAGFQLRLLGKRGGWTVFLWLTVAICVAWAIVATATDAVVDGVHWLDAGLWYADAGPQAWLALLTILAVVTPGFVMLGRVALRSPPSDERRQLRLVLVANLTTYLGMIDAGLAYGIGVFPVGWLLSGIGSLLVVRALIVEDLLRARAVDTTAPRLVLHAAAALLFGWIALALAGADAVWWGAAIALALVFAGVRVTLAILGLVNRGARAAASTLDRLVAQLVSRARPLRTGPDVAALALDVVELGLGVRGEVLLAAADDWGWTTAAGGRVADDAAPDPLLVGWFAEQRRAVFADELELRVPADLAPLAAAVFRAHHARAIVPVSSQDELLALVILPAAARRPRGRELAFLERAGERLGEALLHARMAAQAEARAQLAREVELAADVQMKLLPRPGPHVLHGITVVGSWQPATRCAGDFWGVYPLGDGGRVLVAIGDVTGHGVASATVTAAAAAACDVVVRRDGHALALEALVVALDAAVRRAGGGQLAMTCSAAVLDPAADELRFVSCGHTTPYLCRPSETGGIELQALVGRGNPLGGHGALPAKVHQRPLRDGDLLVWYTDGVIEAQNPAGEDFGDRRLQRMLRRLDRTHLAPAAVHDAIAASVGAHRAGRPRDDDETLVIAQWKAAP